jgi:hypothetical protein
MPGRKHKTDSLSSESWSRFAISGGAEGVRTPDLIRARDALSQLSHGPIDVYYMELVVIVKAAL